MELLIILGVVAVIVLGIRGNVAAKRRAAERQNALAAWAASRNLSLDPTRTTAIETSHPEFPWLRICGDNRYAYNVTSGQMRGRSFCSFDYHYETTTTDEKGETTTCHWHLSAVIVGSDVPLKPLYIRPELFRDKVKTFFGAEDINFESAEFSSKFYVHSPDRRWAYDVLHQRAIEFLLGMPQFSIVLASNAVMVSGSKILDIDQLTAAADVACGILERLPEYVIRQQKEGK